MASSGTYVTEIPLKGSAEKHYNRWRNENHLIPGAIGHLIQGVTVPHGAIKTWNYTCDGKAEVFKERTEIDDENKTITFRGVEGHVMEQLKVYDLNFQFIQKSSNDTICKVTMIWKKRTDDSPEPINYMRFAENLVVGMDHHILKV